MKEATDIDILVSEVGPRDGLQSVKATMPTAVKLEWISALAGAGLREIEVGSFVSPKLLPQMADTAQVVAHAPDAARSFRYCFGAEPQGAEAAFNAGVHKITLPISVSEQHSISNIRKTHAQVFDEVRAVVALRNERFPNVLIEAGVSTAFGCTLQGVVTDDETLAIALKMAELG